MECQARHKILSGEIKPDLVAIQQKKKRLIEGTQTAMCVLLGGLARLLAH